MNLKEGISIVLAVSVIGVALYVMEASIQKNPLKTPMTGTSNQRQPEALPSPYDSAALDKQRNTATASGDGKLKKCIANGKTIYTDQECEETAARQNIELRDTAGIDSPPRHIVDATMKRLEHERKLEQRRMTPSIAAIESPKKAECDEARRQIEHLDSLARRPQSAAMQDWIREQRRKYDSIRC